MKLNQNNLGLATEAAAKRFLLAQGLQLITQNFSCRFGEIDLIMQDGDTLVFVEVRLRRNASYTSAGDSIDYHKQQKLRTVAQVYLQQHAVQSPCRFDAVLFQSADETTPRWIRNAIDT